MAPTFDAFADFRMNGHVAIVTGGAQNIGAGIARTFAGAGAKVMIADLNGEPNLCEAALREYPLPVQAAHHRSLEDVRRLPERQRLAIGLERDVDGCPG